MSEFPNVPAQCLVTIGIPTFNRCDLLAYAIQSALRQTYHNLQIIIADDGSSDATAESVNRLQDARIIYYRHEHNLGMIANWNTCVNRATGDYFLMLNDDDELAPNAIRDLILMYDRFDAEDLQSSETIGFAYGRCEIIGEARQVFKVTDSAPSYEPTIDLWVNFFKSKRALAPSASLFRTEDLRRIGGYDQKYGFASDVGAALNVSLAYSHVAAANSVVAKYLLHKGNVSLTQTSEAIIRANDALIETCEGKLGSDEVLELLKRAAQQRNLEVAFHLAIRNHFVGGTSFSSLIKAFWTRRHDFYSISGAQLFVRGVCKLVLFHCFGWRNAPVR